jgi:transposase
MIEAVPDRLDGAPSQLRRRWSDEIKEQVIAESLVPGANVSAIARRIGIEPSQLFGWRRKAVREGLISVIEPQPESPVRRTQCKSAVVEIIIGAAVIRVNDTIDEEALRRVLRAVRSA